ncbi:hypothetical protein Tco_1126286, partial [Tanacetum coccineum]
MHIIKDVTFPQGLRVKRDTIMIPSNKPHGGHDDDVHTMSLLSRGGPRAKPISLMVIRNEQMERIIAPHTNNPPNIFRSGYQQKDRKPSQNDKTEHGMEKTVQNQGQSPKIPKSESILKNQ